MTIPVDQLLEDARKIEAGLQLLDKDRKVVLPHHQTFKLVEDLRQRMARIREHLETQARGKGA